ncbi:MAG TPA: tetratricopeptide repeat protein [Rhodothermales bacterium]|nr:tetratricopeptide repeat protein [Rhodothermales bacterium]
MDHRIASIGARFGQLLIETKGPGLSLVLVFFWAIRQSPANMPAFSHYLLTAAFLLSGCATSFDPAGTPTSLTKGPQAIPVADGEDVRLQQLFIRGLTRALVDDHRQAIFLFEQAIQIDGSRPAILVALAESYAALDELDTAIYYVSQAVALDAGNRSDTVYLAELLNRGGRTEESLAVLRDWLAGEPDDVETHFMAADLLAELNRQQEALEIYLDLLGRQGDEMPIRYRMLQIYNGLGDLDGMRTTVERMLSIDAMNNSLRHLLSEIYVELDSTDAAIAVLEQAVADNPTDMSSTLLLSKLYRETGRAAEAERLVRATSDESADRPVDRMTLASDLYARSAADVLAAQRAEELLGEMIEEGIETPEVLYMLGDLRYRSAEYLPAAPLLLRAAEMEPRRIDAWTKSAMSFLKGGLPDRALAVAEDALILFPGHYELLRVAGQAALRTGRPEEAIDFAAAALEVIDHATESVAEKASEMLLLQAAAYRLLGVPEGAEHALREALEVAPGSVEAKYWLVMSLLDQDGRTGEARAIAEANVKDRAENALFLDAMGWVEYVGGNNRAALDWLSRAVELDGGDPRSHEHLGDVYSAMGDVDAALEHWRMALALDPRRVALKAKLEQHP